MRLRALFTYPNGSPRYVLPALVALAVTFLVGLVGMRIVQKALPLERQAAALSNTRKFAAAEEIYVELLKERPTGELVLAFLDNHARAMFVAKARELGLANGEVSAPVMSETAVDALLEDGLPPDLSRLGRFLRAIGRREVPDGLREAVIVGADREPPEPWANHALAREAASLHDRAEAARRYLREGLAFPERHEDVDTALGMLMEAEAWDEVRLHMDDPRVARAVSPSVGYRFALHERDWAGAAKNLVVSWRHQISLTSGIMTAVAALAWAFFCARLGKLAERPVRRLVFGLLSFGLGVLSVVPTVFLISIEEAKLGIVETGEPLRDALYFVFGVGLREEASKLLLFAPMLLLLRRWGDKLDVLMCGAMVGLGFAAEENVLYLAGGDLHTALGRFLTANFLHMAMTAILASALDDFLRDTERHAADFSRASLTVVGLHGAYDFLLSHEEYGGSYVAMAVFFFLVRMFLSAVDDTRRKPDGSFTLTHAFLVALAIVTGTSAVYSVSTVGVVQGVVVLAEGLLGVGILIYAFVYTLRRM